MHWWEHFFICHFVITFISCPSLVTSLHCTSSHLDGRRTLGVGDFSFTETDMITIAMIIFIINVTKMIRIVLCFIILIFYQLLFFGENQDRHLIEHLPEGFLNSFLFKTPHVAWSYTGHDNGHHSNIHHHCCVSHWNHQDKMTWWFEPSQDYRAGVGRILHVPFPLSLAYHHRQCE